LLRKFFCSTRLAQSILIFGPYSLSVVGDGLRQS